MVSVAASGSTSWVCDPSLESYALEQPEMLRSPDYRHKCHAPFKCAPTVLSKILYSLAYFCNFIKMSQSKYSNNTFKIL